MKIAGGKYDKWNFSVFCKEAIYKNRITYQYPFYFIVELNTFLVPQNRSFRSFYESRASITKVKRTWRDSNKQILLPLLLRHFLPDKGRKSYNEIFTRFTRFEFLTLESLSCWSMQSSTYVCSMWFLKHYNQRNIIECVDIGGW